VWIPMPSLPMRAPMPRSGGGAGVRGLRPTAAAAAAAAMRRLPMDNNNNNKGDDWAVLSLLFALPVCDNSSSFGSQPLALAEVGAAPLPLQTEPFSLSYLLVQFSLFLLFCVLGMNEMPGDSRVLGLGCLLRTRPLLLSLLPVSFLYCKRFSWRCGGACGTDKKTALTRKGCERLLRGGREITGRNNCKRTFISMNGCSGLIVPYL
jgi:hypothetical protein